MVVGCGDKSQRYSEGLPELLRWVDTEVVRRLDIPYNYYCRPVLHRFLRVLESL